MPQYQRKVKAGLRWWYKLSFEGKLYHSKAIYLTKNEAKKAEAEHLALLDRERRNPRQKPVLSLLEIINERLDMIQAKKSKFYYRDNKKYYSILIDYFGNVPIDSIRKPEIEKILLNKSEELKQKGRDYYIVNAMIRSYKALFNFAIDSYDLDIRNPVRKINFFPIEKKIKYIPTENEINRIFECCDEGQRLLLRFIEETGARINECLNLKGSDILEHEVILYTRKSKNSNRVPRKLPKPSCFIGLKFSDDEFVFGRWKEQPKFLERKIRKLNMKPWGFHNLRHRRASLWSKEGLPIFELMCRLGHSNITTTQRYLQLL